MSSFTAGPSLAAEENVLPGTSTADIQALINAAPPGTVLRLAAGTHILTDNLLISRGDIRILGEGIGKTKIIFKPSNGIPDGHLLYVKGGGGVQVGTLLSAATKDSASIRMANAATSLKAGDFIRIYQVNTYDYLDSIGSVNWRWTAEDLPIRETLAEVVSINGDVVSLRNEIGFNFDAAATKVVRMPLVRNVELGNFSIEYDLGEPVWDLLANTLSNLYDVNKAMTTSAVGVENAFAPNIHDIHAKNVASMGYMFRSVLQADVNNISVHGSHNKGSGGNGYPYLMHEVFRSNFRNLEDVAMRHSLTFAGAHSEAYNNFHIAFTDRDVNFHGGDDHHNTITVDKSVGSLFWYRVLFWNEFSEHYGPPTRMATNPVTFQFLVGDKMPDIVTAADGGSFIRTGRKDDVVTNGRGNDDIDVGADVDTVVFRGRKGDYVFEKGEDAAGSYLRVKDVKGADGTDKIRNAETLRFTDGDILVSDLSAVPLVAEQAAVGNTDVKIRVAGTPSAGVWPHYWVILDSTKVVGQGRATSSVMEDHVFKVQMEQGKKHSITVWFDNDGNTATDDRNLLVESVSINGTTIKSTDGGVLYDKGVLDKLNIIPGQTELSWGGGIDFPFSADVFGGTPPADPVPEPVPDPVPDPVPPTGYVARVVVNASGSPAGNVAPHFNVFIDGTLIGEADPETEAAEYHFDAETTEGQPHTVYISYTNDQIISGQDRNLDIHSVTINGTDVPLTGVNVKYDRGDLDGVDVVSGRGSMVWGGHLVMDLPASYFSPTSPPDPIPEEPQPNPEPNPEPGFNVSFATSLATMANQRSLLVPFNSYMVLDALGEPYATAKVTTVSSNDRSLGLTLDSAIGTIPAVVVNHPSAVTLGISRFSEVSAKVGGMEPSTIKVDLMASGSVESGAGNDTITINANPSATGVGLIAVNSGDGNDTVSYSDRKSGVSTTISAGAGDDVVDVRSGKSAIVDAGGGNDKITAANASSDITGGSGNDVFAIGAAAKNVSIADFECGRDTIDVSALGVLSMSEVVIERVNGDSVLSFSGKTVKVTLRGYSRGMIPSDFVF